MTQEQAMELLKNTDQNIFLTGEPGSGKTHLTKQYVDWLMMNEIPHVVTASTGIAASDIPGAKTLHSFLGVRDDTPLTEEDITDILGNSYVLRRLQDVKVIIIDEISMVSASLLEVMNDLLAKANEKDPAGVPFAGKRIIAVGDFYQLPPVKGAFAFESLGWDFANFKFCELTEQHRQKDELEFIDLLRGIRKGNLTDDQWKLIESRFVDDLEGVEGTRLYENNKKVDDFNQAMLQRLDTPTMEYVMTTEGNEKAAIGLKKNCKSPERLVLRAGAKVIFTQNDNVLFQYVNGTQGEVFEVYPDFVLVDVGGRLVKVEKASWELANGYGENKKVYASVHQIPLRLAWAITLHKSQGMTLDEAIIGTSNLFACGQAYVGVSRVKTLEGLHLHGKMTKNFLMVDKRVVDFYAAHQLV